MPDRLPGAEAPVRGDPEPRAVDDRGVGYRERAGARGRKHVGADARALPAHGAPAGFGSTPATA